MDEPIHLHLDAPRLDVTVDYGVGFAIRIHTSYDITSWTDGKLYLRNEETDDPDIEHDIDDSNKATGYLVGTVLPADFDVITSGVWYTMEGTLNGLPVRLQKGKIFFEEQVG